MFFCVMNYMFIVTCTLSSLGWASVMSYSFPGRNQNLCISTFKIIFYFSVLLINGKLDAMI